MRPMINKGPFKKFNVASQMKLIITFHRPPSTEATEGHVFAKESSLYKETSESWGT